VFSSVILGFFLLSIEEIGVTIEEPFNILPLEVGVVVTRVVCNLLPACGCNMRKWSPP
jgi:hypothetical protein